MQLPKANEEHLQKSLLGSTLGAPQDICEHKAHHAGTIGTRAQGQAVDLSLGHRLLEMANLPGATKKHARQAAIVGGTASRGDSHTAFASLRTKVLTTLRE